MKLSNFEIPLPRIVNPGGDILGVLHPIKVSYTQNIKPLSTATIELPDKEVLQPRAFVEVFGPKGSLGVFRVVSPETAYGSEVTSAELEHAITELNDSIVNHEYSEMMAANTAMLTVFSYYKGSVGSQINWQMTSASVAALGSSQIALDVSYESVLDAMIGIVDQVEDCMFTYDFSTTPWTVGFAKKGTAVTAEGRLNRNVASARVTYDDTDMCTIAYYQYSETTGSGDDEETETYWKSMNADTLSTYGPIEKKVDTGSDYTEEEADAVVTAYLKKHKRPRTGVEINGYDLSYITGESMDSFELGKMFRLVIPDRNVIIEDVITSIRGDDVYGDPEAVMLTIGDEEDIVVSYIHSDS